MSSIFESVLDALKLNRIQPNFKQSSLRAFANHPKCHQGMSKSSSTPARILEKSSIFDRILDDFKLIGFQPNFEHVSLRAFVDHAKHHQGQQLQSGTSKSSSTQAKFPRFWILFLEDTHLEGVMIKIWLQSHEFKGIKNPIKDWWHFKYSGWSWCWFWRSWLGLVSLMTLWMVCKCPEGPIF